MMKRNGNVVIILAPSEQAYQEISNIPPLGLGVLKGFLEKNDIATDIYDLNTTLSKRSSQLPIKVFTNFIYNSNRIVQYLKGKRDPEIDEVLNNLLNGIELKGRHLVGVSIGADFSWLEVHSGLLIAKWIKDKHQLQTIVGGNNLHYLLQFSVDYATLWEGVAAAGLRACIGPGERMIASLVKMLMTNGIIDEEKFQAMPGAVWRDGDKILSNVQDTPSLAMPDFSGLDLNSYKVCINASPSANSQALNEIHFLKWPQPYTSTASTVNRATLPPDEQSESLIIPYIFNFNCPFRCAFCVQSGSDRKQVPSKPTETILDEIETLIQKYDSKFFYFFNNTFNNTRNFVKEFCAGVKQRGLKFYWTDCGRFNNLDYDLIKMMYDAGCRKLVFGFETGSEKLLKMYDKKLNLEHAERVLKWCKDAGIWADIEVIIGFPYEYEEDFMDTVKFIRKNSKFINHFAQNNYFVVPDSLIGLHPEKYGIKLIRICNRYDELLQESRSHFVKDSKYKSTPAKNFQVYRFNEINGRPHDVIVAETEQKANRLNKLYYEVLGLPQEIKIVHFRHKGLKKII